MNYTQTEQDLILLSLDEELTYAAKIKLTENLTVRPDFNKIGNGLIKTPSGGVYNKLRELFYDEEFRRKKFAELEEKGVECVTRLSADYPQSLLELSDPPIVLFLKGDRGLLKSKMFSVVGSRRTNAAALAACKNICNELSARFTVVTGTADGADAAAIRGALPSGKIICVLAYGSDLYYPATNKALIESAARDGLIISEYPPPAQPRPYTFPARNRIIAALGEGTLVVSAGAKSGALVTAGIAQKLGRRIFAFPYALGSRGGEGCNALIKQGARLTETAEDIGDVLGEKFVKKREIKLSPQEEKVLKIIRERGEGFLPQIAEQMNVRFFELLPVVSSLEIKGLIVRLGGNRYAAV